MKLDWVWLSEKDCSRSARVEPLRMQMSPSSAWYGTCAPTKGVPARKRWRQPAKALSVARFDHGAVRLGEVVREMGGTVGEYVISGLQVEDGKRVHHAEKEASEEEKQEKKKDSERTEERLVEHECLTNATGEFSVNKQPENMHCPFSLKKGMSDTAQKHFQVEKSV